MDGTGTNSLALDLSCLTPGELDVYLFARDCVKRKVYPSLARIAVHLGHKGQGPAHRIRRSIIRKVGWVCQLRKTKGGTYNLTLAERELLTTALAIWEDQNEYPSVEKVAVLTDHRSRDMWVYRSMMKFDRLGLLPFRRQMKTHYAPIHEAFVVARRWHGWPRKRIAAAFLQEYGFEISVRQIERILKRHGMTARFIKSGSNSIDQRKAKVIDDRPPGFVLHARDEPAAYRRVVRAGKPDRRRTPSSSRPDCGVDVP
jgi:hypothetical protein